MAVERHRGRVGQALRVDRGLEPGHAVQVIADADEPLRVVAAARGDQRDEDERARVRAARGACAQAAPPIHELAVDVLGGRCEISPRGDRSRTSPRGPRSRCSACVASGNGEAVEPERQGLDADLERFVDLAAASRRRGTRGRGSGASLGHGRVLRADLTQPLDSRAEVDRGRGRAAAAASIRRPCATTRRSAASDPPVPM